MAESPRVKRRSSLAATLLFLIRLQAGGSILVGVVLLVSAALSTDWMLLFDGMFWIGVGVGILALMRWMRRNRTS